MNQKYAVIGLLAFVIAAFGGLVFYDVKYGHKFEKLFGGPPSQSQNWSQKDSWNEQPIPIVTPKPTPINQNAIIVAGNYAEAIKKSSELGRPVLAFFTADWCRYCTKMKNETMPDARVQAALKNYILVYVDSDKERATANKFGVQSLPSFVITNAREEKLKFDSGFKGADSFANWLANPSSQNTPKPQGSKPNG